MNIQPTLHLSTGSTAARPGRYVGVTAFDGSGRVRFTVFDYLTADLSGQATAQLAGTYPSRRDAEDALGVSFAPAQVAAAVPA